MVAEFKTLHEKDYQNKFAWVQSTILFASFPFNFAPAPWNAVNGAFVAISLGALGLGSNQNPVAKMDNDDIPEVSEQARDYFSKAEKSLEDGMARIFGGVNSKQASATEIAQFFGEGRFLTTSIATDLDSLVKEWMRRAKSLIVKELLRQRDFVIFHDHGIVSKAKCDKLRYTEDDEAQQQWLDGGCYLIMRMHKKKENKAKPAAGKVYAAIEKYGVNLQELYRNSYACAKAYPDGDGVAKADDPIWADGGLPQCFYNMPVISAQYEPMWNDFDNYKLNTVTHKKEV